MRFNIRVLWLIVTFVSLIAAPTSNWAATCNSDDSVTCRTVVETVYDIEKQSGTLFADSKYDRISITCYYPISISLICAGGGDFDRSDLTGGDCRTRADGVLIIADNESGIHTQCFERKNFGLNGVVDARQCGVVGDGLPPNGSIGGTGYHPDDAAFLQHCMDVADGQHYHRVSTGGGVILDTHAGAPHDYNLKPAQGMELTCGVNATADLDGDDFRVFNGLTGASILTGAIVLDVRDTIELSQNHASLANCNLVAGASGAAGAMTNPYSPAIWYPNCDPAETMCDDSGHGPSGPGPFLRSAIDEYSAFNPNQTALYAAGAAPAAASVGITITGSKNAVRNVTSVGFAKCYSSANGGKGMIIENLSGDCDGGVSIDGSHEATQIGGIEIKPFLTNNNGDASLLTLKVDALQKDPSSTKYEATVELSGDFRFVQHDTVWIATSVYNPGMMVGGAESAAGRWVVTNDPGPATTCGMSAMCQTLVLGGSMGEPDSHYNDSTSPLTAGTATLNSSVSGVPPNAITGIATDPTNADQKTLQLVSVGQTVTDGGVCIPSGTTVANVWPAQGTVYLSNPVSSDPVHCGPNTTESVNFYDTGFHAQSGDCSTNAGQGCAFVSANERFGDGIVITNSGGVTMSACSVLEHLVAFHWSTNTNSSRFAGCATGENIALPDQDVIGLKIDGSHSTDPEAGGDACGNMFVNGILGQHRTVGIVVKSNCNTPNHLTNVRFGGNAGGRRNAVSVEVDAGSVTITNGDDTGSGNFFKADATQLYPTDGTDPGEPSKASLSIGNNQLPNVALVMANTAAANSTAGCGNTFAAPTPYLCTPPPANLLPGGRLTLCATPPCPAVMTQDVSGAATVYYVPYLNQQVPIYNPAASTFGPVDITSAGLALSLDNLSMHKQAANTLYDIFVETVRTGEPELCSGPAWSSSAAGSSSRGTGYNTTQVTQLKGLWVNAAGIAACHFSTGNTDNVACPIYACTYLGTMYMTANGQTSQQFGPVSGSGGGGTCLCLYNAYNRVPVTSGSSDTDSYVYGSSTWRIMHNNSKNQIYFVDGLAQSQAAAQLTDSMQNASTRTAEMGIVADTAGAPLPMIVAAGTGITPYNTSITITPKLGLRSAVAVESASGSAPGNASFGGTNLQLLSVQAAD